MMASLFDYRLEKPTLRVEIIQSRKALEQILTGSRNPAQWHDYSGQTVWPGMGETQQHVCAGTMRCSRSSPRETLRIMAAVGLVSGTFILRRLLRTTRENDSLEHSS